MVNLRWPAAATPVASVCVRIIEGFLVPFLFLSSFFFFFYSLGFKKRLPKWLKQRRPRCCTLPTRLDTSTVMTLRNLSRVKDHRKVSLLSSADPLFYKWFIFLQRERSWLCRLVFDFCFSPLLSTQPKTSGVLTPEGWRGASLTHTHTSHQTKVEFTSPYLPLVALSGSRLPESVVLKATDQ